MVREKVAGEEELFLRKQETAVPIGMAGEGDDFQPLDLISVIKPTVDLWHTIGEEDAADFFKPPAYAAPSTVAVAAF